MLDKIKFELTDREAVILTVYGEARGEIAEGQIGVAHVILERSKRRNLTLKEVCFQRSQFSCWNLNDPNSAILIGIAKEVIKGNLPDEPAMNQITYLVDGVLSKYLKNNVKNADHYMTKALFDSAKRPKWAETPTRTTIIGRHIFMQV